MKCPACGNNLDAPAAACPNCKFALRRLDTKFGTVPLHSRYLTDRASSLTSAEAKRLGKLLQRFEEKFPQSVFSVFVTDLPAGSNVSEFAFWLANRAQFGSVEAVGENNFDFLLVVEAETGNAALTVGYGLEDVISQDDLDATLTAALPALRIGRLDRGIRLCVEEMTTRLTHIYQATASASKARETRPEENW